MRKGEIEGRERESEGVQTTVHVGIIDKGYRFLVFILVAVDYLFPLSYTPHPPTPSPTHNTHTPSATPSMTDWNTNTPPPTPPHFQSHYRPPSHFSPHPPQYTPPHMSPSPQPPYTPSGNYYMPPRAPRRSQSDNRVSHCPYVHWLSVCLSVLLSVCPLLNLW